MTHYKYTVITRENAAECDLDPRVWDRYPDWNFLARSNIRFPGKPLVWITSGGATRREAIKNLDIAIQEFGTFSPIGEESETIIKNEKP